MNTRLTQDDAGPGWLTHFKPGDEVEVTDLARGIPPGTRGVVENVMAGRYVGTPYAVKVFFDAHFTWADYLQSRAAPRGFETLQTVPPYVVMYFPPERLVLIRANNKPPFVPNTWRPVETK